MWCFFSRKEDIWVLQKEEEEDSRDPCVQQINYRHCNGAVERFIWLFGVYKLNNFCTFEWSKPQLHWIYETRKDIKIFFVKWSLKTSSWGGRVQDDSLCTRALFFHIKISFGDHSKFTLFFKKLSSQHFFHVAILWKNK